MRILYVTHKMMYPVTGGDCIRMSQMLDGLTRYGQVDVMYITSSRSAGSVRDFNDRIHSEWAFRASRVRRLAAAAAMAFNGLPLLVSLYRYRAFRKHLLDVAPDYDRIILGNFGVAHYSADLKAIGVQSFVDLTDSPAMYLDNEVSMSTGIRRLWYKINARRMRKLEIQWRRDCKATAFISAIDRDYLPVAGSRQVIVGNRVSLCDESMMCDNTSDNTVLFVGKMSYEPNILAVQRFARNVLPVMSDSQRDIMFRIVGASPADEVLRLGRENDSIRVDGFVENLDQCYRDAALVVAPMYSGSGIQNKILQAMASGCCVVTTPVGAEGLDVNSGAFVVAGSDEEMARVCLNLLADRDLRSQYGRRARQYVAHSFSSEIMLRQIGDFLSV